MLPLFRQREAWDKDEEMEREKRSSCEKTFSLGRVYLLE